MKLKCLAFVVLGFLCGCSGSGGSAPTDTFASTPPVMSEDASVSEDPPKTSDRAKKMAASVLDLTTFGPTLGEVERVTQEGVEAWLDEQFALPPTFHMPVVRRYMERYDDSYSQDRYARFAFFENAFTAEDQLRQLIAYSLLQIFVVSRTEAIIDTDPLAQASYFDTLLEHSLGNFRDLLLAVTLHPAMGFYLSHVNNAKANEDHNTFPDENYAREIMQLFSIGLYELNPDGSRISDVDGGPIPTYDNGDITEYAKIFTGLSLNQGDGEARWSRQTKGTLDVPMIMVEEFHEASEKHLLGDVIIPGGQPGMKDIEDAIDTLFYHPNVGPFIGKQLIQRLVTSNPSPAYIRRVANVFADDGTGIRGNMAAVIRAILTDEEVAEASRVREPFRRILAACRSLNIKPIQGDEWGVQDHEILWRIDQSVYASPSVFNYYSPSYRPIGADGPIAPEMQISTEDKLLGFTNVIGWLVLDGGSLFKDSKFSGFALDSSEYRALLPDPDRLIEAIELVFFAGSMNTVTRQTLADVLADYAHFEDDEVLALVLYLALVSPDQAVVEGLGYE